jgi:transcriptional regulator with XRE-family HTH domain
MSSPELRTQNLSLLLQGKGAKSALARLIGISQPYMSTIANGGRVLDQAFCRNVAQTLGMAEDWFEAPRTAADIPAAALQRLAPLPRGAAASASAAPTRAAADAQAARAGTTVGTTPEAESARAESSESATAVAAASDTTTASAAHIRPAQQRDDQQRGKPSHLATKSVRAPATALVQADLLTQAELEGQPAAQEITPAVRIEVMASPAPLVVPAPMMAPVSEVASQAVQRTSDFMPMSTQPLIIEGGLAPITEALIKILALKARQGALSEDKAFELLGAMRLL